MGKWAILGMAFFWALPSAYSARFAEPRFGDLRIGDKIQLEAVFALPTTWPVPVTAETLRLFFGTSIETGEIVRQEPDKTRVDRKNYPFCLIQLRDATLGTTLARPGFTIEAIQRIPGTPYVSYFTMDPDAMFKALMCRGDATLTEVETLLGFKLRLSR